MPKPDDDDPSSSLTGGKRLASNAAWNLAAQVVPMAVALATIPLLVRSLGTDRFGVLTLAWVVLGYFSLFDLGLGRALTKLVAHELGLGRRERVPALIGTALALMTVLGAAGGLAVAVSAVPLTGIVLRIPGPLRHESLLVFYLLAGSLPFVIATAGLRGVLEAYQEVRAANVVRTAFGLSTHLGPLLVLPFSRSLVPVVAVLVGCRVALLCVHVVLCARVVPGLRAGAPVRRDLVRPLLGFGGWMTLTSIINPLMLQADRFLIGALVSTAAVTYYTTPYEAVTKLWALNGALLGVLFPAFATSFVGDRDRTAKIFGRGLKTSFFLVLPPALLTIGLAPEGLTLWLGPDFAARGARVLQLLAAGVFLNSLAQVASALLQGVGRPDLTFKLHLIELPLYLVAAWALIRGRGIEGAALAWSARIALDLVLFLWAARRLLPEASTSVRSVVLGLVGVTGLMGLVALPLALGLRIPLLAASFAASAAIAWNVVLDAGERSGCTARLYGVWNHVSRSLGRAGVVGLHGE